jgi:hypothetical protein
MLALTLRQALDVHRNAAARAEKTQMVSSALYIAALEPLARWSELLSTPILLKGRDDPESQLMPGRKTLDERAAELLARGQLPSGDVRAWAARLGCSQGRVAGLPTWRRVMEQTGRTRRKGVRKPKTVQLTLGIEASAGSQDAELQRLIGEQRRDLAGDRRRPRRSARPTEQL